MEDLFGVNQEVASPEIESSEKQKPESDQDRNWKQARETIAHYKAIADRQAKMLEERNQPQAPVEEDEDPWEGLDNDDYIEVKKVKEALPKAAQREARRVYREEKEREEKNPENVLNRARSKYPDFDSVLTEENFNSIINSSPDVKNLVMSSGNPVEAAYQFISRSAEYQRQKMSKSSNAEQKNKLEANQSAPKSPNSLAKTQSQAASTPGSAAGFGRLSKEQKRDLWVDHLRRTGRR